MLGNVLQWVNDWYDPNYYRSSPSQDPAGSASGEERVSRGGCFAYDSSDERVSSRLPSNPALGSGNGGFRCGGEVFAPSARVTSPSSGATVPAGQKPIVEAPLAELAPSPIAAKVNPKDRLKYVWIPPGTFMMGCSPGDTECKDDEKPPHQVTITKGFWLGQTEVTVGSYKRFAVATGRQMPFTPYFNTRLGR